MEINYFHQKLIKPLKLIELSFKTLKLILNDVLYPPNLKSIILI